MAMWPTRKRKEADRARHRRSDKRRAKLDRKFAKSKPVTRGL